MHLHRYDRHEVEPLRVRALEREIPLRAALRAVAPVRGPRAERFEWAPSAKRPLRYVFILAHMWPVPAENGRKPRSADVLGA